MECFRAQEALSALLDGEDPATDSDAVRAHLDGCAACGQWQDDAAELDRRVRLAPATTAQEPDPAARVLPHLRLPRPRRWPLVVRTALAAVALAQLGIAAANLAGPLGLHTDMAPNTHMDHEVTAFNLAFGVTLLVIAHRPRRASGHVPVLASFLVVLAAASAVDLVSGDVGWHRLATHTPIVLGLLLSAALTRAPTNAPDPGNTAGHARTAEPTPPVPPEPVERTGNSRPTTRDVGSPPPPVTRHDHIPRRRSA